MKHKASIAAVTAALPVCLGYSAWAETREHAETAIVLHLPAPPVVAFPLFGPVRETEWSPHWNPTILYPSGQRQEAGAVFVTKQHDQDVVWVLTVYDEVAHRIEYVHVWPGMCVTKLDITLTPLGEKESEATVAYQLTALSEHGDEYVKNFAAQFPSQREHWEQAVGRRLRELAGR